PCVGLAASDDIDGNAAYVANNRGSSLSIVDTTSNNVLRNLSIPGPVAVAADREQAFAYLTRSDSVAVGPRDELDSAGHARADAAPCEGAHEPDQRPSE